MTAGRRVAGRAVAMAGTMVAVMVASLGASVAAAADEPRPLVPRVDAPPASLHVPAGARLPMDAAFIDSTGRSAPLGDWLGGRAALLVPGYYTCPQLCGLLMQGVLDGLHADGLDRAHPPARVVAVSVDPADTPLAAARRQAVSRSYAAFLADDDRTRAPDLVFLTATPTAVRALTARLGWRYVAQAPVPGDPSAARFAHPAVVFVVDGAGRVRSVLGGVRFAPGQLKAALQAADRQPPVGEAAPRALPISGAIALLCAHFDPRAGRYSGAVMQVARGVSLAVLLALAALAWRASRRRAASAKEGRS